MAKATKSAKVARDEAGDTTYPKRSLERSLRIPRAILEQNAGKECTYEDAAKFIGVKLSGETRVEITAALKFGLLDRPRMGYVQPSDLLKKILRPQQPHDQLLGYRAAILKAPKISEVYQHYRGENLPDSQFFDNALTDTFKIPENKRDEFREIFIDSLKTASLVEEHDGKIRLIDVTQEPAFRSETDQTLKRLGREVHVAEGDSCFVMMPFASPLGNHYSLIYDPAIRKVGLRPVRADDDIFATGKIMDQVWRGIDAAKVLVAELTTRNPNVFYELGIAHALRKPVVFIMT